MKHNVSDAEIEDAILRQDPISLLVLNLRDSADMHLQSGIVSFRQGKEQEARDGFLAAGYCEALAEQVDSLPSPVVWKYTQALTRDAKLSSLGKVGCDVQNTMTMEVGFSINPRSLQEFCELYIAVVEKIRDRDLLPEIMSALTEVHSDLVTRATPQKEMTRT